jgi:hypothetical protein
MRPSETKCVVVYAAVDVRRQPALNGGGLPHAGDAELGDTVAGVIEDDAT